MNQKYDEEYKFIAISKDLTVTDAEFQSARLHIYGYTPTFLNFGTSVIWIDNRPFKPGDQWEENVPPQYPIERDYELKIAQDFAPQSVNGVQQAQPAELNGLIAKPGTWLRVTYYRKVKI